MPAVRQTVQAWISRVRGAADAGQKQRGQHGRPSAVPAARVSPQARAWAAVTGAVHGHRRGRGQRDRGMGVVGVVAAWRTGRGQHTDSMMREDAVLPAEMPVQLTRRPRKPKTKQADADWPLDELPVDLSEVHVDKWRDDVVYRVVGYDLFSEDARRRTRLPRSS